MNLFSVLKKQKGESRVMLYAERVEIILQQLQLRSTVKVTELSQLLHVSVDTVRRDLKAMEQEGLIRYIHGGACLPEIMSPFSDFRSPGPRLLGNGGLSAVHLPCWQAPFRLWRMILETA